MFKLGGSAGEGITSGLKPRQGYHAGERVTAADILTEYGPAPRGYGGWDALTEFGLNLASATPRGNVISTAAHEAKGPFQKYTEGKGQSQLTDYMMRAKAVDTARAANVDWDKMAFGEKKLAYEEERDIADRALQKHLGELEAKGEKEFILERINAYWDPKIAEAPSSEREQLTKQKESDTYNVIVLGEDISDKYKILNNEAAYSIAIGFAEDAIKTKTNKATGKIWIDTDTGYHKKLQELINFYLRLATKFLDPDKKASGGRVGYQNAGAVGEGQNVLQGEGAAVQEETNEINISYDQLRNRLPAEISDDIVLLLSQSYEAFADFSEIQTQADVNEFNIKYNVQLFLPQQSGS